MNDSGNTLPPSGGEDYSATLFLPKTDFPMRAGLPQKEPALLAYWRDLDLYGKRRAAGGQAKFVLHDGPPYANGNIHIGHALNKILKDLVTRSQQALGKDSNYVPGWDCHGLPIEWKIEEEYRAKGRAKPDFSDPKAIVAFRRECRAFAQHWLDVQREEFKRLGVIGDWDHPYTTMSFPAEAQIAREIMKFAANGLLYRGSKPVMWSVVEKTALAEAEVEYEDYTSDAVYVAFPAKFVASEAPSVDAAKLKWNELAKDGGTGPAAVVIWTTTPWTLPANRAIAFSPRIAYGLYLVTGAPDGNWAKPGARYVLADKLAESVFKAAKVESWERLADLDFETLAGAECAHPLAEFHSGYGFRAPLLPGDHVTDDAGTGFVHTAPGHGREDFELWTAHARELHNRAIETHIPFMVDAEGFYTDAAPGLVGARVIDEKGNKGDANQRVIDALVAHGRLLARARLKHQYPHSWRSKKPVIFRNTPQWFIAMDRPIEPGGATLREVALNAIGETQWVPASGENRIRGMIANRPDWVVSRQRAWGVPIAVFLNARTGEILRDDRVDARILEAFEREGADAWFAEGAAARFLKPEHDPDLYWKVDDVLDVWFDSGSTHAFTLEDPVRFPGLSSLRRKADGGPDEVMYLEGSDQHRGWFHSSLLESCGTRGRAPYDAVLTHGFVLDEQGRKMSKSLGNVVAPQTVIRDFGADILRLWVAASDYSDDLRMGKEILATFVETYRKLRNTLRWTLGALAHWSGETIIGYERMDELDRLMLHRLGELDSTMREAYAAYDFKRVVSSLSQFMNADLSAFYFDIRKDALYCDPLSSETRLGALEVLDWVFRCLAIWLSPILCFTCEEAWLSRYPDAVSVHLQRFPDLPATWRDEALAARWAQVRRVRSVVTGALERERAAKKIGSSLEAAPRVFISDPELRNALHGIDLAEVCITSAAELDWGEGPADAFRLPEVAGVAVRPDRATGRKCARSWKISPLVGADPEFPEVTPRDAQALRELIAAGRWRRADA